MKHTSRKRGKAVAKVVPAQKALTVQDTSTDIQRQGDLAAITPWGAISSITDAFANCVNVWNRERNITVRVVAECNAMVKLAHAEVEKLKIKKHAFESMLKQRDKDREMVEKNLERMWIQVEMFDEKLKELDIRDTANQEFIANCFRFKKDFLGNITALFGDRSRPESATLLLSR